MATIVCPSALVIHLPARRSVEPPQVEVCHYCRNSFQPTEDPDGGSLWDVDDRGEHCCDDCHCAACLAGHDPDETCPSAPVDWDPIAAREDTLTYGADPYATYGGRCDAD